MIAVIILERLLAVVVILLFVTQVVIPSFVPNLRYFWLFRKSEKSIRKREEQLADIQSRKKEVGLDKVIAKETKNLKKEEQSVEKQKQ